MILFNGLEVKFEKFPNGETRLLGDGVKRIVKLRNRVTFKYEDDSDLVKLMFLKNYIDELGEYNNDLVMYYMPYSRMDRSENESPFTLKYVSNFINSLKFNSIKPIEPHSDVTPALLDHSKAVYVNFDLLPKVTEEIGFNKEIDYLFFPDAGAAKRYHSLKGFKQLVGHKDRDFNTGEIKSLKVVGDVPEQPNKIIIVDDLSSFGGTFLHSSNALKELGFKEVYLLVSHAEYSIFKGELLKEDGNINKVFTTNTIISVEDEKYSSKIKIYDIEDLI